MYCLHAEGVKYMIAQGKRAARHPGFEARNGIKALMKLNPRVAQLALTLA